MVQGQTWRLYHHIAGLAPRGAPFDCNAMRAWARMAAHALGFTEYNVLGAPALRAHMVQAWGENVSDAPGWIHAIAWITGRTLSGTPQPLAGR